MHRELELHNLAFIPNSYSRSTRHYWRDGDPCIAIDSRTHLIMLKNCVHDVVFHMDIRRPIHMHPICTRVEILITDIFLDQSRPYGEHLEPLGRLHSTFVPRFVM